MRISGCGYLCTGSCGPGPEAARYCHVRQRVWRTDCQRKAAPAVTRTALSIAGWLPEGRHIGIIPMWWYLASVFHGGSMSTDGAHLVAGKLVGFVQITVGRTILGEQVRTGLRELHIGPAFMQVQPAERNHTI
jgi:hypothetical protein